MSTKVSLTHYTGYTFARPVNVTPHVVRLRPAPHSRTPVEAYSLDVSPANHFINWQQDPFGNWVARLVFPEKIDHLSITVSLVADLMVINPFDFFIEEYAESFPFEYEPSLKADLAPYLRPVDDSEQAGIWKEALPALPEYGVPTVQFLAGLNSAVHRDVAYDVRMEEGVQTPDDTLARAIGSCRDSAWLLVSLLRKYGLAARFVSGYLVQLAADQQALDGPSGTEVDFTDLHAWTEVYIPGAGWVGMDPTSALFAGEGHIPLSATPHPSSAAPIEGRTEPVEVTFDFRNEVVRIHEDPRTTKPYTDQQWASIDALGGAVDQRLIDGDVRLTMGGEPTFVALDDATSAEWNTDADGEHKRELAGILAERLRATYALGGVVHRGQGKWYPGETLPRWNIALQWRTDGQPLWNDPELLADPWGKDADSDARSNAEALARAVTAVLGIPDRRLLPAYEDPFAEIAAEIRKPEGPRPDLDDAADVDVAELDRTVSTETGWVLPLTTEGEWTSPAWTFRRGRLVLTPGSSAVGLRLPLDSISWEDPEHPGEPSYLEAGPPLSPGIPKVTVVDPKDARTTAVTFEARDGHVHVFLPPTITLEAYCDLLMVIEKAAELTRCRLVLEGYGPPPDARLTQLIVTPDPGVIEVNVQPTSSWADLRHLTVTLYEQARQSRLATEKFDLDGLHTGTGGGNHITLGGSQPVDSPLLRRPDLLASLITYWQRHPSLSYLFSGRFIGPTSQAPRFDEGRPEAVYEMEIALQEIRRLTTSARELDEESSPWLVDRALRHLLTDLTGNTHRAEFCIDKLYSPDSQPRSARAARAARIRDAAASAARTRAGAARAQPRRDVLGEAAHRSAREMGHPAARGLPAARGRDRRHRGGRRRSARARHRVRGGLARRVHRIPLPQGRHDPPGRRDRAGAAAGHRALERARRRGHRGRHRPLRGLVGRAHPGESDRPGSAHAPRDVSGCSRATVLDRSRRRVLRRCALPRLAAVVGSAPVDPGARPARLRRRRHRVGRECRRCDLPRGASRRPVVRPPADQLQRGRGPPRQPVRAARPHRRAPGRAGAARGGAARVQPRLPAHAGPAQGSDRVTPLE